MSLYVLVSPGGSPGVTTAALALTLIWPRQVILAECDPSGGDVLAGLLGGHALGGHGLLPLALEAGHGPARVLAAIWEQVIPLDDDHARFLLAGVADPRQAASLEPAWPVLSDVLATMPADVIADCGRLDRTAGLEPLLAAASVAVLVLRPTLRQVSKARSRLDMLAQVTPQAPATMLLLSGEGSYPAREVSKALAAPVAGCLPLDGRAATVLTGGSGQRRNLPARPLIRAALRVGRGLREAAAAAEQDRARSLVRLDRLWAAKARPAS
jgi:hypothetical protein